MATLVREKRRNSVKRKEKSRDAARCRRGKESEIFYEIAALLPLPTKTVSHLDKASLMRVTISWLKIHQLINTLKLPLVKNEISDQEYLKALDGFILVVSRDGDIIFISENVTQFLGLAQMHLTGQSVYDYSHPCDHSELTQQFSSKMSHNRRPCSFLLRMKTTLTNKGRNVNLKSATWKVIQCTGSFVVVEEDDKDAAGMSSCLVVVCQGIPHPSNIESPLDSKTFISRHSMDMKFTFTDSRVSNLLGYCDSDLSNKSMYEFHHAMDSEHLTRSFRNLFAKGQTTTGQYRFLAKMGGYSWVQTQATIIYNQCTQKPQCVVCVNHVLSGVEEKETIIAVAQQKAQQEDFHQVLFSTDTVFAPLTKDANQGFLALSDDDSLTVVKDEPEDLTHLAPEAGDVCIPLAYPPGMFDGKINLYDDILFPSKGFEPMFPEMVMDDDGCQRGNKKSASSVSRPDSPSSDCSDSPKSMSEPDQSSPFDVDMIDKLCATENCWETGIMADKIADKEGELEDMAMSAPHIPMGVTDDMFLHGYRNRHNTDKFSTIRHWPQRTLSSCTSSKCRSVGSSPTNVGGSLSPRQPVVQLSSSLTRLLQTGNLTQNTARRITDHHYAGIKRPIASELGQSKRTRGNSDVQQMIHKDLKSLICSKGNTPSLDSSVLKHLLLNGEDINHGYSRGQKPSSRAGKPGRPAPGFQSLTRLDCEVNAPVASHSGLLDGQRLLTALDGQGE
ncbi:PREDICTED: hypoxia-inducible factor 1-alpha-like isoform X2 [Priapulus caudatus]|uniref:Hypoxia-inducible factor 1-alpha-like isoform X2 n=1 Tax=Priapulus caudatus TaxID=37621 RepID=A0ABM1DT20_PRICU|nr:PREDICTED: hypoxia-inducible factor 1-alpha-like isoform X2 [Priapulus caudatus]